MNLSQAVRDGHIARWAVMTQTDYAMYLAHRHHEYEDHFTLSWWQRLKLRLRGYVVVDRLEVQ